jgi:signal transduction histidine kinase
VLSHEINNSLAPIKSVAATRHDLLDRSPRPPDYEDDLRSGLAVVAARADSLGRFMGSYARLAKLPSPSTGPVDVGAWVDRVAKLETRLPVRVVPGPPTTIEADGDQLDQVLINVVKNAAEAAAETGGAVEVTW